MQKINPKQNDEQLCLDKLLSVFEEKADTYVYFGMLTQDTVPIGINFLLESYKTLYDYELKGKKRKIVLPQEKKGTNGNAETLSEYTNEFKNLVKTVAIASGAMARIRRVYIENKAYHIEKRKITKSYSLFTMPIYEAVEMLIRDLNVTWHNLREINYSKINEAQKKIEKCKPESIICLEDYVFQGYNRDEMYKKELEGRPNLFRDAKSMCLIYQVLQFEKLKDPNIKTIKWNKTNVLCKRLEDSFKFETVNPAYIDVLLEINRPSGL